LECGGISVFTEVMTLFEGAPQIDGNALHAFAAKCAGKKGVDTFAMADEMIRWVLVRAIKYASGDRTGEFTDREQALYGRLGDAVGLDRWLEVWDKVDELLASTDRVNLDRKQVILNTFSCVSQAASAR
jgi:DNA polymerase-3 subunit delta'